MEGEWVLFIRRSWEDEKLVLSFNEFGDGESHPDRLVETVNFEDELDTLEKPSKPSDIGPVLVSMLFVFEHADERQSLACHVTFETSGWMDEKWKLEGHLRGC